MLSITNDDLTDLTRAARAAGRRRMNRNLHPALTDQVQRLLNAFEPGTYVRTHRPAAGRWELFLILRGRAALRGRGRGGGRAARRGLRAGVPESAARRNTRGTDIRTKTIEPHSFNG